MLARGPRCGLEEGLGARAEAVQGIRGPAVPDHLAARERDPHSTAPHSPQRMDSPPCPPRAALAPPGDKLKDITGRQQAAAGMGIYGPRTVYLIAITGYPGTHEFLLMDDGGWARGPRARWKDGALARAHTRGSVLGGACVAPLPGEHAAADVGWRACGAKEGAHGGVAARPGAHCSCMTGASWLRSGSRRASAWPWQARAAGGWGKAGARRCCH